MKNIFIAIITLATLMAYNQTVAQNNCELDVIVPVKTADFEINDTLPDLPPPPPDLTTEEVEGYRMLYFIHGLNGDVTSWAKASSASRNGVLQHGFPARKVYPRRPEYESDQSLEDAAEQLEGLIDNISDNLPTEYHKANGIAIGHSQGGIVGRELDRYYSIRENGELINAHERRFGGLITLATPNQGAQILNNQAIMQGLVSDLSKNLAAGPISEIEDSPNVFIRLIARWLGVAELADALIEFINKEVVDAIVQKNMPKITKDYQVPVYENLVLTNQSKIPDLNSYEPVVIDEKDDEVETKIVAFYAVGDLIKTYNGKTVTDTVGFRPPTASLPISQYFVETKVVDEIIVPISWGTIHFQINNPNDIDHFEADTADYLLAYRAHKTKNFYDSKELQNRILMNEYRAIKNGAFTQFPPQPQQYFYGKEQEELARNRMNAWKKGSVFLSKFDEFYRIAIGARYSELETRYEPYYTDDCECTVLSSGQTFIIDCILVEDYYNMNELDCVEIFDITPITTIVWHNKDSDGVVLVESQREIPQSTHDPVPLFGVTHMQVRNSSHTAEMLQTVFEGGVGLFFETEKK